MLKYGSLGVDIDIVIRNMSAHGIIESINQSIITEIDVLSYVASQDKSEVANQIRYQLDVEC